MTTTGNVVRSRTSDRDTPIGRSGRGDAGTVAGVWINLMMVLTLAAAGLVFDGGRALQGERYASTVAAGAARAAVAAQNLSSPSGGSLTPDPQLAEDAARRHAAAAGINPDDVTVHVEADTVTVTVVVRRDAVFASLLGADTFVMHGTGSARYQYVAGP
jgi:hypothetical protein